MVAPAYRGVGLGTALFETLVLNALEHRLHHLITLVPARSSLVQRLEPRAVSTPTARRVREPNKIPEIMAHDRAARLVRFLELEVWPDLPEDEIGRRLTREDENEILGYGPAGA